MRFIAQIVPLFLMDILGDYDGLPGLFIAAIFAAALRYQPLKINPFKTLLNSVYFPFSSVLFPRP
jgi:hypothetical protein